MLKVCLLITLAIAGACAQEGPEAAGPQEAAPEPYAYAYETDSHGAAEQRGPDGRVTGYYTLADADGRQRRVEYYADETGFHAKVQTNEVGTKSENPADVEVLASPPNREQFEFVAQAPVVSGKQVTYSVQQPQYASYSGSYYPTGYQNLQGAYYNPAQYGYGVSSQYGTGYGSVYGGYGAAPASAFSTYNSLAAPGSSYYRTVSSSVQPVSSSYLTTSQVRVPGTSSVAYRTVGVPATSAGYRTVGYQTLPAVSYQTYGSTPVSYQSSSVLPARSYSSSSGSSNYIVLKKREAVEKN